ncbi:hypothetical protein D3C71_1611290 [compost metagenome]
MLLQPALEGRPARGDGIGPARRFRQTVARHATLYPGQRTVGPDAVAGRDKQRVTTRLATPHPAKLLAFIFQRRQRAGGCVQRGEFTAQALFGDANGRYVDQQTEMAGNAQTARV